MAARLLLTVIVVAMVRLLCSGCWWNQYALQTVTVQAQFDNTTCGTEKGCMCSPPGCNPQVDCHKAFSWKVIDNTYLHMELTGISSNGATNYIAVGFSSDQKMARLLCWLEQVRPRVLQGDTPVTDCTFSSAGSAVMHLSFNDGHKNGRITDYVSSSCCRLR